MRCSNDEMIVDYFAGGGGASTGIELALGRPVDLAVNHDQRAIEMHQANHPLTEHKRESVFDVDLRAAARGRRIALLWGSPDCTHFSKAKGGAPVKKEIRGLAWSLVQAAASFPAGQRPRVMILENVEEFMTWGPIKDGKPIKERKGETFRHFIMSLQGLGYAVEWRILKACDYGAPTSRKRFYMIARCDGLPIVWPEPTHGKGLLPYRTAAECIDFSIPCPSIFTRKKKLADNTTRRIARGLDKFTIKSNKPFIVPVGYGERQGQKPRVESVDGPLGTVVSTGKHNLVDPALEPFIANMQFDNTGSPINDTAPTAMTGKHHYVAAPYISQIGQSGFSEERAREIDKPLSTICRKNEHCLSAPQLEPFILHVNHSQADNRNREIHSELPTVTGKNGFALSAPHLTKFQQQSNGQPCDEPMDTVMAGATRFGMISPSLIQYHAEQSDREARANSLDAPIPTVDTSNRYGLNVAYLTKHYGGDQVHASGLHDPAPTVTGIDHNALTTASMLKYYSSGENAVDVNEPCATITANDRVGIQQNFLTVLRNNMDVSGIKEPIPTVTAGGQHYGNVSVYFSKVAPGVDLKFWPQIRDMLNEYCGYSIAADAVLIIEIDGVAYFISEIGMRMLTPRELFNAQGFPPDYKIDFLKPNGKPYPKSAQVARAGNSVCPPVACALVTANLPELAVHFNVNSMAMLHQTMEARRAYAV